MGAADIYAEVDTTIDAQYNVFMSIDDMTTKQLGYAFNFESWTQHDGFESKIWTQNGVQLYTANWMTGNFIGKNGKRYPMRAAICLETQHFPDSPNHENYPSVILRPHEKFESHTQFKFSVREK